MDLYFDLNSRILSDCIILQTGMNVDWLLSQVDLFSSLFVHTKS